MMRKHTERHRGGRAAWLRAAVLGANDGLISTSSLVVGVAAAQAMREPVMIAALAGMVSGALSMAAGEYVSVSSQSDTERADLERERLEIAAAPKAEHAELARIYTDRGLTPALAEQVAEQLMAQDALAAHARDELGIFETTRARPIQAAFASAASFAVGALVPVLLVLLLPITVVVPSVVVLSLLMLALLGGIAARLGGAPWLKGSVRVAFWGAVAMGFTEVLGRLFGVMVI